MLEGLSVKLSKYLSPQVYKSIFIGEQDTIYVADSYNARIQVFRYTGSGTP